MFYKSNPFLLYILSPIQCTRLYYHILTLLDNIVEGVVIDTMGIEGRKKSILASYHGRDHTIGSADLRAVSTDMSPLYSGGFRSTDSEAMNKISTLLRDEPILGCVMASKKYIYVDGLNVRKIVEDLGHLILYNVRKSIIPVYEICESVERSNYLKRKIGYNCCWVVSHVKWLVRS
ncbi:hypothetical protein C5S29_04855 [ANME-1 cluster archaeon GoMg3.2]|nr:hypothetical protein [ANME-1 cluster archaeon GoMg3.2]